MTALAIHMPRMPLIGPIERVAVGAEGERAVDELLDAGLADQREVLERLLQLGGDAVEVVGEQLEHEVPRRLLRRPRPVVLLVGAEQDALALLAGVDLAGEVDHVGQLAPVRLVVLDDLGHRLGHQVVVLHGQHGQLEPAMRPTSRAHRPPAFTTCSAWMVWSRSVMTSHVPSGRWLQIGDPGVGVHLGAAVAGADGVGVGDAVRVDAALVLVVERADEELLLQQRVELLGLLHGDDLHVHAQVAAAGLRHAQPVETLGRVGQLEAAGEVDAAVLAGLGLDLLVQVHRVLLQAGHVRVAVQRVHAAGGVPGAARRSAACARAARRRSSPPW